jgi:hypothetical protein
MVNEVWHTYVIHSIHHNIIFMKRTLLRSIFVIIVLLAIVYLMAWKSPQYYIPTTSYNTADSIVPFEKYTGEHERPFIIKQKRALIFGATHTKDRNDPQIPQMEELWGEFHPTIALVEGRLGFLLPLFMNPVKELGEGGWVKALAHKDGVKIMNWDLSKEALADSLRQYFTKEQIALQQILNPYFGNLRFGKPASPENFIKEYLKRASFVGLQDSIRSVEDVDRLWKKYFPVGPDWRDTSDEYALPGYLASFMATSNDIRNRQLVTIVKELTEKGERVFLICGSSHAYCVAPAFP